MDDILSPVIQDNSDFENFISDNVRSILSENLIDEKELEDERKQDNKSDLFISGSNDNNNLRSVENVRIEGYTETLLYSNSNPSAAQNKYSSIQLSDSILDYDILVFNFRVSASDSTNTSLYVKRDEFTSYDSSGSFGLVGFNNSYYRTVNYVDSTHIKLSDAITKTNTVSNYNTILVSIYGLNYEEPVTPDQPSGGGNTIINNNYYGTVSGNTVSDNILTKKLNDFSTAESMCAISIMLCLGVIFASLCRRAILKWK